MKKTRVLHCLAGMNRGGMETMIMNMYRKIDKNRLQFDFLVSSCKICAYDDEIAFLGGTVHRILEPSKAMEVPFYLVQLIRLMRQGKYDVVQCHSLFFCGIVVMAARLAGVKTVIAHSHNTDDGRKATRKREAYRFFMRVFIRLFSTHLFACSEEAFTYLFGRNKDKRKRIIKNAIDVDRFINPQVCRASFRRSESLPSDALVFVHVGRFDEQKNHIFLMDVFYEILKRKKNSRLLLIGDGHLKKEMEEKTKKYRMQQEVKFLGLRTDIPEILAAADIFLMPSLHEGLPLALVEAQVAGLPCFISDSIPKEVDMGAGLVEFLQLNMDAETWAKKILASDKSRKPEALRKVVEKGYSIQDTLRMAEEIYLGN